MNEKRKQRLLEMIVGKKKTEEKKENSKFFAV